MDPSTILGHAVSKQGKLIVNSFYLVGISKASFYRVVDQGIAAIIKSDELAIQFPDTDSALQDAATRFRMLSTNDVIKGCVGAVDGWLCQIKVPAGDEAGNIRSFFSGHYQCYGLNVQACCDSSCKFIHVSITSPGGTNDVRAFAKSKLSQLIKNLPMGLYLVGDNAYIACEQLLTPFSGRHKNDPTKDAYNFHLSQLRIRIEQAFGMLVNKWRIFKSPLCKKLKNVPPLIMAAMRLHNFCVNERETNSATRVLSSDEVDTYIPSYDDYMDDTQEATGYSSQRNIILGEIKANGITRPVYNQIRNIV